MYNILKIKKIFYPLKEKALMTFKFANKYSVYSYSLAFTSIYSFLLYNAVKYDYLVENKNNKNKLQNNPANYFVPF